MWSTTFALLLLAAPLSALVSHRMRHDSANFFSLGAHLQGDALYRRLRFVGNDLLAIPEVQLSVDSMAFVADTLNESIVKQMADELDQSFLFCSKLLRDQAHDLSLLEGSNGQKREEKSLPECSRLAANIARGDSLHNLSCVVNLRGDRTACKGSMSYESIHHAFTSLAVYPSRSQFFFDSPCGRQLEFPARPLHPSRRKHWKEFVAAAMASTIPRRHIFILDTRSPPSHATEYLAGLRSVVQLISDLSVAGDEFALITTTNTSCPHLEMRTELTAQLSDFLNKIILRKESKIEILQDVERLGVRKGYSDIYHLVGLSGRDWRTPSLIIFKHKRINSILLTTGKQDPNDCANNSTQRCLLLPMSEVSESLNFDAVMQLFSVEDSNSSNHTAITFSSATGVVSSFFAAQSLNSLHISFSQSLQQFGGGYQSVLGMEVEAMSLVDILVHSSLIQAAPLFTRAALFLLDSTGVIVASTGAGQSGLPLWEAEAWVVAGEEKWREIKEKGVNEVRILASIVPQDATAITYEYNIRKCVRAAAWVVLRSVKGTLPNRVARLASVDRETHSLNNLVYHRFDIQNDNRIRLCEHLGALSMPGKASLFLPPRAFQRPLREEGPIEASNTWVYLSDRVGVLSSYLIRRGIREDAAALAAIAERWTSSEKSDEWRWGGVIRRFAATRSGVLVSLPAATLETSYDPSQQMWFRRALTQPGRLVFSGPYTNERLGEVVTISTAVLEGVAGSMHDVKNDQVFGVIAMEVTSAFLEKLLIDAIPGCSEKRCVLLSESGDVLASAGTSVDGVLSAASLTVEAVEKFHVGHLEPTLATQLMQNEFMMQKRECAEGDGGRHRYYALNTTHSRVHSMFCGSEWSASGKSGNASVGHEQPLLYAQALVVSNTNSLLALINTSCPRKNIISSFCPCSVSDRRCLLCDRFYVTECECPCRCAEERTSGSEQECQMNAPQETWRVVLPRCGSPSPAGHLDLFPVRFLPSDSPNLSECYPFDCSSLVSESSCLGRPGCSWCRRSQTGASLHGGSRCVASHGCYRGVLGASPRRWPISWRSQSSLSASPPLSSTGLVSFPFGPLLAALLAVALIGGIAFGCYRSQATRMRMDRSCGSLGPLLLSAKGSSNSETPEFVFDHETTHEEMSLRALISFEQDAAVAVPPPRMPPPGAATLSSSSDHGYSTMTATVTNGEESECTASVCCESEGAPRLECWDASRGPSQYLLKPTTTIPFSSLIVTSADVHREDICA